MILFSPFLLYSVYFYNHLRLQEFIKCLHLLKNDEKELSSNGFGLLVGWVGNVSAIFA